MKKVEFAKELRCSPSTITWLAGKGMPVELDGSLDRDRCLRWVVRGTSGKDGGWGAGRRGASLEERAVALLADGKKEAPHQKPNGPGPVPSSPEFLRGAEWMAMQVCSAARTCWPELVGGMTFDSYPEAERLPARAFVITLMIHLLEGWAVDYIDAGALPAVDWSAFGKDGARLRRGYEEFRAEMTAA